MAVPVSTVTQTKNQSRSHHPYSKDDVAQHRTSDDLWVIIHGEVFNLTQFQEEHPGGSKILQGVAGKDATKNFQKHHRDAILLRYKERLQVGILSSEPSQVAKRTSSRFLKIFSR